jgi:predicted MFS family arabinose efflux permease
MAATVELASAGKAARGGRFYALLLLTLGSTISIMDRTLTAILQEPIRHEFHLSDTALGLLTGLTFAIPAAIVSVPFGMLADRVERSRLLAACLALWSMATALCGLVGSFGQLVAARMLVAIGEAAGSPASTSMVADLYPRRHRSTAIGFHYMALPVGATLAIGVGGMLAGLYGWRTAFLVAAGPGLLLSLLMLLTMRAPPRGQEAAASVPPQPLREVLAYIGGQRALAHLIVGMTVGQLVVGAIGNWSASFFVRYHHMEVREVAKILAPLSGAAGLIGVFWGGWLSDQAARSDPARAFNVVIGSLVLIVPASLVAVTREGQAVAFGAYGLYLVISYVWMAGVAAMIQNLAGPARRATVWALTTTIVGLLGSGLGPQLTGVVSDLLKPYAGTESLRWALIGFGLTALWAAAHMALARRTYRADVERAGGG